MTSTRPPIVGRYELLQDFTSHAASIRVFRLSDDDRSVEAHIHQHTTQFYVLLEGNAVIELENVEHTLKQYEVLEVPRESLHGARAVGGEAILLNISVPPLRADDQVAVHPNLFHPDLALPKHGGDVED